MTEHAGTADKKNELNDLSAEQPLTPEEKEELAGAGRFRPTFEAMEAREMMDAGLGAALVAPLAPADGGSGHVRTTAADQPTVSYNLPAVGASAASPSAAAKPIFSDDFNRAAGSKPDPKTWREDGGHDPNNNNVNYTNSPSTLQVVDDAGAKDGKALALTINKVGVDDKGNPLFKSARIMSQGSVAGNLVFGRVEARIRLSTAGDGKDPSWPAFWLYGSNGQAWPKNGEIDIMEYNAGANSTAGTLVTFDAKYRHQNYYNGPSLGDGQYHTFAVDWSADSATFSVDGTPYKTVKKGDGEGDIPASQWKSFTKPYAIILNIAAFPGAKADFTSRTMYVDYVRAYAPARATAAAVAQTATMQPLVTAPAAAPASSGVDNFAGASNASAMLSVANGRFWVGDDKTPDRLRLYDTNTKNMVAEWKFPSALGNIYDIEAVTRVDDVAYWSTSGGNGNDIVFATKINKDGTISDAKDGGFLGKASGFRKQIIDTLGTLKVYNVDKNAKATLAEAMSKSEDKSDSDAKSWYNIEGLVMKPGETTAYFGLRAPLSSHGAALLIPVLNFKNLFQDANGNAATATTPQIGTEIKLDGLASRGIRDIVYHAEWQKFVILGGNTGKGGLSTELYVWDGSISDGHGAAKIISTDGKLGLKDQTPDVKRDDKGTLVPKDRYLSFEAIGAITGSLENGDATVYLLADDGGSNTHGKEDIDGKAIRADKQFFSGLLYSIPKQSAAPAAT
jgi:beta-glucanase (GH16 family)